MLPVNANKDQGGVLGCFCVSRHLKANTHSDVSKIFPSLPAVVAARRGSRRGYLSSLRHGAAAVGSAAAVHHLVPRLEQTQAQRATQVPGPKDAHHLRLRGAHGMQSHALWLHLSLGSHAGNHTVGKTVWFPGGGWFILPWNMTPTRPLPPQTCVLVVLLLFHL